ncbi:hypothetical protein B0T09DRAFT_343449 [Sordaria sp. MPI-SDFR-AT-0083]|nr:hypothetical protein B0T09DRAFT_343449 [Sordaria sp. MPI-SDFR-AT-0083]
MQVAVVRLRGDQNALGLLPCLLASAMLGSNGATVQWSPIRKVRRISGSHGRTAKNNPNSNRSEIIVIASAKPYKGHEIDADLPSYRSPFCLNRPRPEDAFM